MDQRPGTHNFNLSRFATSGQAGVWRLLLDLRLNFDSVGDIAGVPSAPVVDYYDYAGQMGDRSVRWAALGGLIEVTRLTHDVQARGQVIRDGDLWLLIADEPTSDAAKLSSALRARGA